MSRYVDADDVLEMLNLMYDEQEDKDDPYNVGVMGAINYIKHRASSIDIVRCGECKAYDSECKWCGGLGLEMTPDDFCSYGERENDEGHN